ncbi:MAG: RNA polymerase sigma factor [Roseiflexaceae bacterium]
MPTTTQDDEPAYGDISIEWLYQAHQRRLIAYLTRLVRDRAEAEDLCQETFLKAIRGWTGRNSTAATAAWLYRIATNTAYDHLRRRAARPLDYSEQLLSRAPAPALELDTADPVRQALAQLPARYRLPLILHIYQGYSLGEIAAALGCSYNAVKMRMLRARERFQQIYQV